MSKVEVIKNALGNFELQRNGVPYYIKGAGAKDHFELLKNLVLIQSEFGAQIIRHFRFCISTWSYSHTRFTCKTRKKWNGLQ